MVKGPADFGLQHEREWIALASLLQRGNCGGHFTKDFIKVTGEMQSVGKAWFEPVRGLEVLFGAWVVAVEPHAALGSRKVGLGEVWLEGDGLLGVGFGQ